jgi:hypothetical protein
MQDLRMVMAKADWTQEALPLPQASSTTADNQVVAKCETAVSLPCELTI